MDVNKIYQHNVLDPWPIADASVDTIVTSPPYWGLRNYGMERQIGMEETPEGYVETMVGVLRDARRVLKPEGTLWLNIGDTYMGGKGANGASQAYSRHKDYINKKALVNTAPGAFRPNDRPHPTLKAKQMVGIPWKLAFALQADGWTLRQDIIWSKPNAMPENVLDRCTKSHEYIFMFSKSRKYFFDYKAIQEDAVSDHGSGNGFKRDARESFKNADGTARGSADAWQDVGGKRNKRSVWTVNTVPFKESHFATFPPDLIIDCIKAGCPAGGLVLDPFMGAGTTALVARSLYRNFIGLELNPKYITMAEKRLKKELGFFL